MINKKNIISIVVSLLFLIAVLVYLFVPLKGFQPIGTMKDFNEKTVLASELNNKKEIKSKELFELRKVAKAKEDELDSVSEASKVTDEQFEKLIKIQEESGDWTYHLPSLLIELEKNADSKNINIAMEYDTFAADGEYVSNSGKGLQYLNVKVDVYGEYYNVKDYMKSLEDIDFISVEDLVLTRVGSGDLVGKYDLNIYYLDR